MAWKLETDGSEKPIDPDDGTEFTLKEMQTHIGGYVEYVAWVGGRHFGRNPINTMWVNEDGLGLKLDANQKASEIAGHPIVGPVVLIMDADPYAAWKAA
jgi:hypothetical protein